MKWTKTISDQSSHSIFCIQYEFIIEAAVLRETSITNDYNLKIELKDFNEMKSFMKRINKLIDLII